MKVSVLMPVYNEARTLRTIIGKVLAAPVGVDLEIICVDDCSQDSSLEILQELSEQDSRIRVIAQPENMGKGKAIRTAIAHMTGDIAIVQDADLEYDPAEYEALLSPIVEGRADAVFGSRFAASQERRVLFFWHALGNKLLTLMSNMANDLNLTDMETCYKAIRADLLKNIRLTSDRFGFEPEITARLAQWGARIYEVPISYHGRTYAEGKNIGWRDGLEALWLIAKFRFIDNQPTDEPSFVTRKSLASAPRFRRWVLAWFGDYLRGIILEYNAGPGHTTPHLLTAATLIATDEETIHVETLRRRFGHLENVQILDFADFQSSATLADTVVLFDSLQRVPHPIELLSTVARHVNSGGNVLIQVPGGPDLFGPTDTAAGHLRRFDRESILEVIAGAGLDVQDIAEINRLGAIGWQLHNTLGLRSIGRSSARLFDLLVPVARVFEGRSTEGGLSLVAVARVP